MLRRTLHAAHKLVVLDAGRLADCCATGHAEPARDTKLTTGCAQEEEDSGSKYPDGYDSDLLGDDEDREKLSALSMLAREMEIFERGERRREMMDALAAERKMRESQPQPGKVWPAGYSLLLLLGASLLTCSCGQGAANKRASTRGKAATATPSAKSAAFAELNAARSAKEKRTYQQRKCVPRDSQICCCAGDSGSQATWSATTLI